MNDIEEEFFKTFGIEPIGKCNICTKGNVLKCHKKIEECEKCEYLKKNANMYAYISSKTLLELICILGMVIKQFKIPSHLNIKTLRGYILRNCINCQEGIYTRVRSLFEVVEE